MVYINNLPSIVLHALCVFFVDDVKLYIRITAAGVYIMTLMLMSTSVISYSIVVRLLFVHPINLEDFVLKKSDLVRYLSMLLDSGLTFQSHCTHRTCVH